MLKAGFARLDVTPPFGTNITGYFYPRIADGILDPIYLNAIALSDGDNTILIVAADFMAAGEQILNAYRKNIESATGIPFDNIIIQSVHQHTSITPGESVYASREYNYILEQKFTDLAVIALADLDDATAAYAEQETAVPVSFNRRFWMKDGTLATNPKPMNPDIDRPADEADNTVRVIKFQRANKNDIALVQFQTHPDVIGGTKFSADWPGFVRTYVENELPNAHCMLLNGFQGDVNHYDVNKARPATQEEKYAHSKFMGRQIADAAIIAWNHTQPIDAEGIAGHSKAFYMRTNTNGIEDLESSVQLRKDYEDGKLGVTSTVPIVNAFRITNMVSVPILQTVPVSVLRFGKVSIVGFPGEPFNDYAVQLRKAFPDRIIFTACLANGKVGYFPSEQAYSEGGYEVTTAILNKEIAPKLLETAITLLNK